MKGWVTAIEFLGDLDPGMTISGHKTRIEIMSLDSREGHVYKNFFVEDWEDAFLPSWYEKIHLGMTAEEALANVPDFYEEKV